MIDRSPYRTDGHGGLRVLALAAVAFGVLLLAAAAFVLSYAGIHAVALSAGVSPRLARIYPLIFDAMLVVTCASVLSLRGAGLPSRTYAWLSMLVLLAAAAAADALHATGSRLPRRPAAATVAVIPWALVLIGFGLLLCMLRQARLRRAAAAQRDVFSQPSGHVTVRSAIVSPPGPGTSNGESAARLVPAGQPDTARVPPAREEPAGSGSRYGDKSASAFSPALTPALANDAITENALPGTAASVEPGLGADDADGSGLAPGPAAESEPALEAEPVSEAESEPEAEAGAGAGAELEADAGPTPAAPQFDRMRSSPLPPQA